MEKEVYTSKRKKLTIVLDSSGSMLSKRTDVVSAINALFRDWKSRNKDVHYQVYTFAEFIYLICESFLSMKDELDENRYQIGGSTSLYDAVCHVIEQNQEPNITFVIVSDGKDNSSKKTLNDAKNMVQKAKLEQEAAFIFIGEGEDSFAESKNMGIENTSMYAREGELGECIKSQEFAEMIAHSLFPEDD
jgi:uncharacterized protein with von Willebrand factor type A (vWA) domain